MLIKKRVRAKHTIITVQSNAMLSLLEDSGLNTASKVAKVEVAK